VPGQPGIRRARAVQQPQPGVPGIPGADSTSGATSSAPRFIADERTNAIVVIATKNVLREVERIISLLDYKRKGSGRIHVYRLRNADADEIAQTLSSLASGSPGGGGASGSLAHRHHAHFAHRPGLEHEPRGQRARRAWRRSGAAGPASAVADSATACA
jgi:hypothetical protein